MGQSKTEIFTAKQNALAMIAKAIGHPARVAILEHLLKINACVCGDLVEEIGLAQSTISQHLKALKEAGLIRGDVDGTSVCYCIDEVRWGEMREMLQELISADINSHKCC